MNYQLLKERIDAIISCIEQLGGEVQEAKIDKTASIEDVKQKEELLGVKLPNSFKKVLTEFSGSFGLRWFMPKDLELPDEFNEIFCGTPHWDLNLLIQFEEERRGWVDSVFSNQEDEYDAVWHNKLAFCEVGNGDYLAFDITEGNDAPVIYLSHDDGEGHGYKLANNFGELIDNWSRLAFVGCEDWQWIPFTTSSESGLLPDGEAAKRFRTWIDLDI